MYQSNRGPMQYENLWRYRLPSHNRSIAHHSLDLSLPPSLFVSPFPSTSLFPYIPSPYFFPSSYHSFSYSPSPYVLHGRNDSIYFGCVYSTCWSIVPSSRKCRTKHGDSSVR